MKFTQRKPREYKGWLVAGPAKSRFTETVWDWYAWRDGFGYMYAETLREIKQMITSRAK